MSKKKGLSLDEKRTRLMDIFYQKKEAFQLKEVEKIAQKEKGISPMLVKDLVQGLVDDNLVDCEKIGTSNYFWAFPSKAQNIRKRKLEQLTDDHVEFVKRQKLNEKLLEEAKVGREDSDERDKVLEKLKQSLEVQKKLSAELKLNEEWNPEVIQKLETEIKMAKDAVNRWTENVFLIKTWCKKKFSIEESVLDQQFQIPEDLDYIE